MIPNLDNLKDSAPYIHRSDISLINQVVFSLKHMLISPEVFG